MRVSTAAAGSTIRIGIWEADGTGNVPSTALGYADFSGVSTGHITQTTFSASIPLVAEKLYWYSAYAIGGTPSVYASNKSGHTNGSGQISNIDNGGASIESSTPSTTTFSINYMPSNSAPLVGVEQ